jgi:hypothetical protein
MLIKGKKNNIINNICNENKNKNIRKCKILASFLNAKKKRKSRRIINIFISITKITNMLMLMVIMINQYPMQIARK